MRDVEKLILEPTGKDIALLKLDKYGIGNISIFDQNVFRFQHQYGVY